MLLSLQHEYLRAHAQTQLRPIHVCYVAYLAKVQRVEGVKAAYYTCNCHTHKVDSTYNTAYLAPRRKQRVHVGKPLTERFAKPFTEVNRGKGV